jgi:hypothetical protein
MVAGERPGDPDVEQSFCLEGVFDWYRDCPEQIECAVFDGGKRREGDPSSHNAPL